LKTEKLNWYICGKCKSPNLKLRQSKREQVEKWINCEVLLVCDDCGESFPIINNIPRFVPHQDYTTSFGFQWNVHRTTQPDSYTGLSISRDRLHEVTGWPENMEGQTILEAGSGAGRFTEILAETGAEIFSFDFSSAVDANFLNNGHFANLEIFQGDIYNIPIKMQSFDKVLCLGVIQHTPDPEKAFKRLSQYVRPGGELVVDVYRKSIIALMNWKYLLRPFTKRMDKVRLYRYVQLAVSTILPAAIFSRRVFGTLGSRLFPIAEYSHLGLSNELNRQWAVLDTFDMYAPKYDQPQSLGAVQRWFENAGFRRIEVQPGPNGIVGRGIKN